MANRERGEVAVTVGEESYTLRPDFNAVCELEQLTGQSYEAVIKQCFEGRLSGLRACVWCLLQRYHAASIKTLSDAGDWIERAGGVEQVLSFVNQVLEANDEPSAGGPATANPRRARVAGIGGRSSSRRVKSA
jgi:hypothetical protein